MTNKQPTNNKQKYSVKIDDNFNFMDAGSRYSSGEYDTYKEAVARCKQIVDEYLESALKPGMTAEELYGSYTMFGEDPFIIGDTNKKFSSWDYAKEKSKEMTNK